MVRAAVAFGPERRDERDDRHQSGVGQQSCGFGGAADVLGTILAAEAEVAREAGAQRVAVEHEGVPALGVQRALQFAGDGRFTRTREAGEPHGEAALAHAPGAIHGGHG